MTMTSTAMKLESPSRHHNNKPAMLTLSKTAVDDEFVVFPKPVKVITSPLKTKSASFSSQQWPSTPISSVKKALVFTPSTATSPLPPKSPSPQNFEPIVLPSVALFQKQQSVASSSPGQQQSPCTSSPSSFNAIEFLASKEIEHILYPTTLPANSNSSNNNTGLHHHLEDLRSHAHMNLAFGFEDDDDDDEGDDEDDLRQFATDEDEDMYHHATFDPSCLTPPARTDNPINMDIRFRDYHFSPSSADMDCELGLFNFSPPLCSSH